MTLQPSTQPSPRVQGEGDNEPIWADAERRAWRPIPKVRTSVWAETNRYLTRRQSAIPGPWRNANNPALIGIMDLADRSDIQEIWLRKRVQGGGSEAVRNVMGAKAQQEPDSGLIILPNEKDGRKIVRKRLIPLFEDTPCLRELLTSRARDKTLTAISLTNGFDLQLGWSGSASSLASDPMRFVFPDEVDKYDQTNVKEAPPVELARARTTTYGNRSLIFGLSTPTTADGSINTEFNDCHIHLFYFVPCPHCGKPQQLTRDGLQWEKFEELAQPRQRAARILARSAAWYECVACKQRIVEHQKAQILPRGFWATDDLAWQLHNDGTEVGTKPEGNKVGVHFPASVCFDLTWAKIASMTVAATGDAGKLRAIKQNVWAEPWEDLVVTVRQTVFSQKVTSAKALGFKAGIIPRWAAIVLMTVDTQLQDFWYVVRAWGQGYRSRRLAHGQVSRVEDLAVIADQRFSEYEKDPATNRPILPPQRVAMVGIDSGGTKSEWQDTSRTDQVYQWCNADPIRRRALKGSSRPMEVPWRYRTIPYTPKDPKRMPYMVQLMMLDSHYFNDILASAIHAKVPTVDRNTGEVDEGGAELWELNDVEDPEYDRHLSNMHKVAEKRKGGSSKVLRWRGASEGGRFDLRMCEVYQLALAYGPAAVGGLPSTEMIIAAQHQAHQPTSSQFTNPLTSHKNKW